MTSWRSAPVHESEDCLNNSLHEIPHRFIASLFDPASLIGGWSSDRLLFMLSSSSLISSHLFTSLEDSLCMYVQRQHPNSSKVVTSSLSLDNMPSDQNLHLRDFEMAV